MAGLVGGNKTTATTASRISTFQVTESSYGAPISIVIGTHRVSAKMLDYDDFVAIAHTTTTTSGGKGGTQTTSNTDWTYTAAAALCLGEGINQAVGKIWKSNSVTDLQGAGFTFFNGAKAQEPWGHMLTNHPIKALRYTGISYVAGVIDLGNSASLPNYNFEVYGLCQSGVGVPSTALTQDFGYNKTITLGNFVSNTGVYEYVYGSGWIGLDSRFYTIEQTKDSYGNNIANTYTYTFNFDDRDDGYDRADPSRIKIAYTATVGSVQYTATDANPADIILTLMTNKVFGARFPVSYMGDLGEYKAYCSNNGLLLSEAIDSQTQASDIISSILEATNSDCIWSQGKFQIIPYLDGLVPLFEIDDDNIQGQGDDSVVVTRSSQADAYNVMPLEFKDRSNDYNSDTVYATDQGHADIYGVRQSDTKQHHHITVKEVAQKSVQFIMNKQLYIRNQYTFKLGQEFIQLDPMDPILLTCKVVNLYDIPVRIVSIRESKDDWTLEIVAEDNPTGVYGAAQYDIQESDRYKTDYNVAPGNASPPVLFELPSSLSNGIPKTYIATAGGQYWGGCEVWLSDNGDTYKNVGKITAPARYGLLMAELPAGNSIDTVHAASVDLSISRAELLGGTQADAQNMRTLCWVDGELIAYATATLIGANQYSLSYLVRGCYGSKITAHAAGSKFVRVDMEALGSVPYSKNDIGKTIDVKLQSFNIYGAGTQDISALEVYDHTITQYYVPQVSALNVVQAFRETGDSTITYELTVSWATPDPNVYAAADVYLRSDAATEAELGSLTPNQIGNVPVNRIGLDVVPWKQIGSGLDKFTFAGAVIGATYKIMVVARDGNGVSADIAEAPTIEYTVTVKPYTPTMPTGMTLVISDKAYCAWNANTDTDVDFYELRANQNIGESIGLLFKGSAVQCSPALSEREGTLYLYAHNPSGHYSGALSYRYSFPAPAAPIVTITDVIQGFVVATNAFPARVLSLNVHIDDGAGEKVYASTNNTYEHTVLSGIFDVTAAFVDYFGEGVRSSMQTIIVKPTIPPELIEEESLALGKMDITFQDAMINASAILSQFVQLVGSAAGYSGIAQLSDDIQLRVVDGDGNVSLINISQNTITLNGKFVHITGDTLIDNNLIVNRMIKSGELYAEKIAGGTLNLSNFAKIANADGSIELTSSHLKMVNTDSSYQVLDKTGYVWYDSAGTRYGALRRMISGMATNGQYVRFNHPWSFTPQILLAPQSFKAYTSGSSATMVRCYADLISTTGFRVNVFTVVTSDAVWESTNVNAIVLGEAMYTNFTSSTTVTSFYTDYHYLYATVGAVPMVINFYAQQNGSTTWTHYASYTRTQSGLFTEHPFFTCPTPGSYRVKIQIDGGDIDSSLRNTTIYLYRYSDTIIDNTGKVSFVAVEADAGNEYTVE